MPSLIWEKLKNYQPKLYVLLIVLAIMFLTTLKVNALLLVNRVSGYIVLDVENHGEAWYIPPDGNMRYYLGLPGDAFGVMRNLGIGISNENLKKIPVGLLYSGSSDVDGDGLSDNLEKAIGTDLNQVDTDDDGYNDKEEIEAGYNPLGGGSLTYDNNLIARVAGKILLQVEDRGEAWYVSPETKKRYYLGRPRDAFFVMRNLGLGITGSDLKKIKPNVNLNVNDNNNSSIPENYNECVSRQGEKIINALSCWWLPRKRADINKCKEIENHWNGPETECALIYYNPNFIFPENIEQCLAMEGMNSWQGASEETCDVMILENGIYNKEVLNDLSQKCPGIYSSEQGCSQMFRKYTKSIPALPRNYNDCEKMVSNVYPTGWSDNGAVGYTCMIMLNKIDYPILYQECIEQGGVYGDKVAGTQGLGEGCSVKFKN